MSSQLTKLTAFLDTDHEVRVYVFEWLYQKPIDQQFIVHPKSAWLVWNYFKRVGFRAVLNKIKSRLAEQERNKKIAGIGIGRVVNSSLGSARCNGKAVVFFAPNHSQFSEYLVIDHKLFVELKGLGHVNRSVITELPESLEKMVAWTRSSGLSANFLEVQASLNEIAKHIPETTVGAPVNPPEPVDRVEAPLINTSKPTAVLFGLGNYAKTAILPNIKGYLQLQRVHEIDPEQLLFLMRHESLCLDTSPRPRDGLMFDAWFIAGYHHTHAGLAIDAIHQGATAVIEKPLATTRKQYDEFLTVLKNQPQHRFYLCFHKRYSALHSFFERDLGEQQGEPIDMHCIVYEIPLPRYHWYNWPNSGSRLISNGCHWIDYFMFINDYCEVIEYKKWMPRGSDAVVQLKLSNGAYFSMSLTDTGSKRLGVRDHIELRVKGITFSMIDGERYVAENRSRIFRKARVNPLDAYARMYQKISQNIAQDNAGDSLQSLRSTDATLLLEEL